MIQSGREAEARELALAEDLQGIPRDAAWPIVMLPWADSCSRLRIPDRASELHGLHFTVGMRAHYRSEIVVTQPYWVLGSWGSGRAAR